MTVHRLPLDPSPIPCQDRASFMEAFFMTFTYSVGKIPNLNKSSQFWLIPAICLSHFDCDKHPLFEKADSYGIVFRFGIWSACIAYRIYR